MLKSFKAMLLVTVILLVVILGAMNAIVLISASEHTWIYAAYACVLVLGEFDRIPTLSFSL